MRSNNYNVCAEPIKATSESAEWIFLATNLGLEILSAACDQASSPTKPHYALFGMLLAIAAVLISIWELIYRGKKERVVLRGWGRLWWFYHPPPRHTPFGTLPDIYGLVAGISQCICSIVQYVYCLRHAANPFKASLLPAIFLVCLGGSKLSNNRMNANTTDNKDSRENSSRAWERELEKRLSHVVSMGANGASLEEFSLEELLEATSNFSEEHKIGTGSFGSVYYARLTDGRQVAIKRAETSSSSSYVGGHKRRQEDKDNTFVNELEFLSRLNHKNLVRLLGFFEDTKERILVYEYMNNATLHDHLHNLPHSPLVSWPARIIVALDAARGIEYLHMYVVPPVIHRDIKSSNILLDDTLCAKVSDFGLSLMGPEDDQSYLSLRAAGTFGYMDPEYYRLQQLTTKSDVYSFGVVLLELLSGYNAIHKNENGVPRNVVDFVVPYIVNDEIHRILDPKMPDPNPFEIEAVAYVGYLAADCVSLEGRDRPSMTDIVSSLERALTSCLQT